MRELERRRAISGRVDARIAGAQVVIDMDSRDAIVLDVRGFESKAFYGRGAAGADDNFIDGDFRLRAARFDAQNLVAAAALDPQDRAAVGDRNAVASERGFDRFGCVAILRSQYVWQRFEERDLRAKTPKRLR